MAAPAQEDQAKTEKIKRRSGLQNLVSKKLVCCTGGAALEREISDGSGDTAQADEVAPKHLVIMVNGILGRARNWRFAEKEFLKRLREDVVVHCSQCNVDLLTLDGVDVMGKRLAQEVMSIVNRSPELCKISFVGHSLGGLIARYAIAELFKPSIPQNSLGDDDEHEDSERGKIAGLEPMNFITFATPHVGSRWHKQIPMLGGVKLLEKVVRRGSWILGRTGRQLFLDDHDGDRPPLLAQMVTDSKDLPFISALRSFRRRVVYSNARFDHIVGWITSSIRHRHELPKVKTPKLPRGINGYRHVVRVELPKSCNLEQDETLDITRKSKSMQEGMIDSLNKVQWERVDVSFHKTMQRIFAHETIQVKTRLLNSAGADVISHMIDNFLP
ncbi:lipid droplet phospholipase 1-like [Wolffia australiana]